MTIPSTPLTDAAAFACYHGILVVDAILARRLERANAVLVEALEVADEALVWKHMPDGAVVQEHEADNITHPDCNRCKAVAVIRAALEAGKVEKP